MREQMYVSLAGEGAVVVVNEAYKEERRIYVDRPGRLHTLDFVVYGAYADGLFALSPAGELLFTAYAGAGACDIRITADGSRAYALCADADTVSVLEIGEHSGLLQCMPTGGYPRSMDLSADESRLIIACAGSGSLMLCSADTLSLMGHRMVRGVPCYAVFCGNYLVCSVAVGEYRQEGRVCVFDPTLTTVYSEICVPGTPTTIYPLGDMAIVGYIGGLMCLDVRKNRIIWQREAIGFPDAMYVHGEQLIVADLFENTLHIMTLCGETQAKLDVGLEPSGITMA